LTAVTPIDPVHRLLAPELSTPYLTRARVHNYDLSFKIASTDECSFIYRVLYKKCFSFTAFDF